VLLTGATALEDLRSQTDREVAALGVGEFDSRVTSLTKQGVNRTTIEFSNRRANGMRLRTATDPGAGTAEIRVNGGTCNATVPLSTLTYEEDQQVIVYQGGGIFRGEPGGATALVAPPDFTYDSGTIDLEVVNLTGRIHNGQNVVTKRSTLSEMETAAIEQALFTADDECRRPDNVTLELNTEYPGPWAKVLSGQTAGAPAGTASVTQTSGSVELTLDQNALPRAANDSANDVIVLKNNTGNGPGAISGEAVVPVYDNDSESSIVVDKTRLRDGENNFTVFAEPIANGTQVSYPKQRTGDDVVYRPPLDVMFVIDGSGSMGWNANTNRTTAGGITICPQGPDSATPAGEGPNPNLATPSAYTCERKDEAARKAAKSFVGQLNSSIGDRGGVVEYNRNIKRYKTKNFNRRITGNFSDLNTTIDETNGNGGTRTDKGMIQALDNIGISGNSSHQQVMIVLSDGVNDNTGTANPNMIQYARDAKNNGVTVYTVGLGDPTYFNQTLLNRTATIGEGEYYNARNASQLDAVFNDIFAEISSTSVIYNPPVGLNGSVGSQAIAASVGDGDDAASIGGGSNVNDPTASAFRVSNVAADGDVTNVSAYRYDCAEYRTTNVVRSNSTLDEDRVELRCAEVDQSTGSRVPLSDKNIYLDGEDASNVLNQPSPWWEGNLSRSLDPYVDDSTNKFDLASNEAIIEYRFGSFTYRGTTYEQRLILRYEVGVSNETTASDVVDVTLVTADIRD
jgi:Mg-chelatase subunit ChlD